MARAGYVCISIIHQTLTWTTGSLSCAQMLVHVIAHWGLRTPKESALKVDREENPLPHLGIEPASAV